MLTQIQRRLAGGLREVRYFARMMDQLETL